MTTGPAKPVKYVSFRKFVPRRSAPPFLCERRCTSLSGGIAGNCSTSTMCVAPSIAHPRGVPSGPSCSSGMATCASYGSLAARAGPALQITLSNGETEVTTTQPTFAPSVRPATTSDIRRRAMGRGRVEKSRLYRGEPGWGEVRYGAELGGGVREVPQFAAVPFGLGARAAGAVR